MQSIANQIYSDVNFNMLTAHWFKDDVFDDYFKLILKFEPTRDSFSGWNNTDLIYIKENGSKILEGNEIKEL